LERFEVTEPYGYVFQHGETGLQQVVDAQQAEWGFEKNNPHLQNIGPVYLRPQSAAVRDGWQPIDTAPKDGTPILARYEWQGEDRFMTIRRHKKHPWWMADHDSYIKHDDSKDTHRNFGFTHWRTIPALLETKEA
jgi:hypothetical protein